MYINDIDIKSIKDNWSVESLYRVWGLTKWFLLFVYWAEHFLTDKW